MPRPLVLLLAIVALMAAAPASHAAFPGANGKIAFGTDRTGNEEIFTMDSAGGAQTNLTNDPRWDRSPAWSTDGTAIAFSRLPGDGAPHQIYRMNADGTGQTRVSPTDVWSYDQPSWSPDGTQIVAYANRDPGASQLDIVRMDADGTDEVVLTFDNSGLDLDPAWSPDGGRIAFASRRGASSMDIYVMGADGSSPVEITGDSLDAESQPNWSPDGQKIAYVQTACVVGSPCVTSIHVMDANGAGDVTLTSSSSQTLSSPAWSPDGAKIVYQRGFPGNAAIHVMNADGSGDTQIGGNPAQDTAPDWQPIVTGYARPKGASPLRASLVPAFAPCSSPDRTHGPPLAFGSCSGPDQVSSHLTVGTPDANAASANSVGFVHMRVAPGAPGPPSDTQVWISTSVTDVRCAGNTTTCGNTNTAAGADYAGELELRFTFQGTDKLNGPGNNEPGTMTDYTFHMPEPCTQTADPSIGSQCGRMNFSMDAIVPGIVLNLEGKRAIWQIDQIRMYDGGADGDGDTTGDNTLLAVQGVFIP